MTVQNHKLRGDHAIKLQVSTQLKSRLAALAESLDRPLADVCRTLLWMGLPILEGMDDAHQRGQDWWARRVRGDVNRGIEEVV